MKDSNEMAGAVSRRSFVIGMTAAGAASPAMVKDAAAAELAPKDAPRTDQGSAGATASRAEAIKAAKIQRAMRSGPPSITKDATVVDMDSEGKMEVLRKGTNKWVCMPGNENIIGDVPMCADPMALQWFADAKAKRPKPTNATPGICYMLCGATQHSNTDPFDTTSAAIPIGPHWMILWPFDAEACGLPTTVRDQGAWVMFAGTPYAYLHICGSPWEGNEYSAGSATVWTMAYHNGKSL